MATQKRQEDDDVIMTDKDGKVTGNIGKDTVIIDGVEMDYQEAFKKVNEDENKTDDRS